MHENLGRNGLLRNATTRSDIEGALPISGQIDQLLSVAVHFLQIRSGRSLGGLRAEPTTRHSGASMHQEPTP